MALFLRVINLLKTNLFIVLIIALGLAIRISGVYPGVHHDGDEVFYGQATLMILNKNLSIESSLLGYPPLVYWIFTMAFVLIFVPLAWIGFVIKEFPDFILTIGGIYKGAFAGRVGFDKIFLTEILGDRWIHPMYWGRYLTSIIGALTIYLTYLVSKKYFGSTKAALFSALFVALNYRLALNSMVGFPDMYNVLFLLLAFVLTHSLISAPNMKNYIKAWVGAALSFLVKYQIYALVPLFIAHIYISWQQAQGNLKNFLSSFFSRKVIVGGLISLTIVLLAHGQYFVEWEKVSDINAYEVVKYGFGRNILNIFPISYLYHIGVGPILSMIFLLGVGFGLLKKHIRLSTLLLLSPFTFYVFIYFYYTGGGFHTRNLISLIPVMLIFAGLIPGFIIDHFFKKTWIVKVLSIVFVGIFIGFALKNHVANIRVLVKEYSSVTSYERLDKWLDENIKGDVVYGAYPGNPTPSDSKVEIRYIGPTAQAFSASELAQEGYDYLTLDFTDVVNPNLLFWMHQSTEIGLKFWNKPDNLLSQNYIALASREYLWRHTVKSFLAPWQAPGFSYSVFKVDPAIPVANFSNPKQIPISNWAPLYYLPESKDLLTNTSEGLRIIGSSLPGAVRWQSSVIPIAPKHVIKVIGKLKNEKFTPKTARDGFLRLDFYENIPETNILSRPIISFVSSRVYGENKWQQLEITAIVPEHAKYMTVNFQADGSTPILLGGVQIQESLSEVEDTANHIIIPDQNLFTPSLNGFL